MAYFYPVSPVFQLYRGGQCTYPCFPGVLLISTLHSILSKPLAAFQITIVETTDSGERGMNPVAMTIINPRNGCWPSRGSNQRLPVLKSATLPTELWGSAYSFEHFNTWKNRPKDSAFSYTKNKSCMTVSLGISKDSFLFSEISGFLLPIPRNILSLR